MVNLKDYFIEICSDRDEFKKNINKITAFIRKGEK